jgi:hypothetical protein
MSEDKAKTASVPFSQKTSDMNYMELANDQQQKLDRKSLSSEKNNFAKKVVET